MARESIFARKKREKGTDWHRQLTEDELFKISESILNDIAYGNMDSPEDKQYLMSIEISRSLYKFCYLRWTSLEYIVKGLNAYRNNMSFIGNEADNAENFEKYTVLVKCEEFYKNILIIINSYWQSYDQSYIESMIALCKSNRGVISPNRII